MPVSGARRRRVLLCTGAVLASVVPAGIGTNGALSAPVEIPWHLDRLDQRMLPLDDAFARPELTGRGINIYVVDSGVRATHEQFGGRVAGGIDVPTLLGTSVVNPPSSDCDGHGTHVSGLAAGSTVGVAPGARVISVRVLNCNGDGEIDDVVTALRWIRAHHRAPHAAVVNLSLGVDLGDDGEPIDREVLALMREGVVVTVAAGNGDLSGRPIDACRVSPADVPGSLTVGAVTIRDTFAWYSNYGRCVDILAPGGDAGAPVVSSWKNSDTSYGDDVGTSMASPLVAGYVALLAERQPHLCVAQYVSAVLDRATTGEILGLDSATPNRLLYLDTAPITDVSTPDHPSHVVATADDGSLVVSWDPPCNGGSPIKESVVSLLRDGKVVARASVGRGIRAVRMTGLRNGVRYRVAVKTRSDMGWGQSTGRLPTPAPRRLRVGSSVRVSTLGTVSGGLPLTWRVSAASRSVCAVRNGRLVGIRAGVCRVGLRTIAEQAPVVHNLTVRP